jgi:hypothetical protein
MSGWTRLGRDCPICNGDRKHKDCRQSVESGLIFCHDDGANPAGWIFRGFDKHGFGIWQDELEAKAFSEKSKEDRQQERLERRQQQRQRKQAQIAAQMPVEERDRWNRKLIEILSLNASDRTNLEARGFDPEKIEAEGYRSVEQWQTIPKSFPANFPGRTSQGNLAVKLSGILCPIPNVEQQIVSFQNRRHDDSEGRYGWMASTVAPVHVNGELPLGVYQPERSKGQAIWLTDSPAIKSSLASQLLGVPVVGAANGNFHSSPELTCHTLSVLSERYQTTHLVLAIDAGDVKNRAVCQRWQRQHQFLTDLGYSIWFAWWGQVEKTDYDIDELKAGQFEQIQFISLQEFEAIAAEHGGLEAKPLTKKEQKAQQRERRRQLAHSQYQKLSQLTAERFLTINTRNLNFDELALEPGVVYILCSAKGTRKTEGVRSILPQFKNIYSWFNRIALGREECHRLNLTWREEMGSYQGFLKVGFCSNSSYKFNPRHLQENGLLLVDECDQVFDHNFSSICNRDGVRPLILNSLSAQIAAAISGNGMALFMSADISDRDVDYIKALTPPSVPVRLIVNEYQPERGTVILSEAETPEPQVDKLIQTLEAGIPCFVIDDIKDGVRGCKSIAQLVLNLHPEWADKIIEINSETSCTEAIQLYLKNINQTSKSILLMACTPSVISGISMANGHFRGVFGFFNGVLTISQASQSLARVRGAAELNVWAGKRGLIYEANRSPESQAIRSWYQSNYETNSKYLGSFVLNYSPLKQEFESPHFALFCQNAAYRNACQTDLRELLRQRLIDEGYTIQLTQVEGEADETIKTALKETWQGIELDKVRAIAASELLSDSELSQKISASTRPTREEQNQIEKTLLYKKFGQELIDSLTYKSKSGEIFSGFEAAVLKNRQNRYQKDLEAFHLLQCSSAEAALKDWEREDKQLRQSGERFAGDVRWSASQKELREVLGLNSLQPGIWYSPAQLQPIIDKARERSAEVKNLLNFTLENISDGQIVGQLFSQIGLVFDEDWVTPEGGGKRYKERRINQQSWDRAWKFVRYRESLKVQPNSVEANTFSALIIDPPPVISFSEAKRGGDQIVATQPLISNPSSPVEEALCTTQSECPEPLRAIVQGVEQCQSFKEFISLGQKTFMGKSEGFLRGVFQFLSPESSQKWVDWSRQLPHPT